MRARAPVPTRRGGSRGAMAGGEAGAAVAATAGREQPPAEPPAVGSASRGLADAICEIASPTGSAGAPPPFFPLGGGSPMRLYGNGRAGPQAPAPPALAEEAASELLPPGGTPAAAWQQQGGVGFS